MHSVEKWRLETIAHNDAIEYRVNPEYISRESCPVQKTYHSLTSFDTKTKEVADLRSPVATNSKIVRERSDGSADRWFVSVSKSIMAVLIEE